MSQHTRPRSSSSRVGWYAAAGLGALGLVALAAPAVAGLEVVPPCPLRTVTGLDCPFCGGTRATRALVAGDVGSAFDYNLLVPLAALLAVIGGLWWTLSRAGGVSFAPAVSMARSSAVWIGLLVVLVVFWVARNLPWFAYLNSGG